jgi:hypothetical protein
VGRIENSGVFSSGYLAKAEWPVLNAYGVEGFLFFKKVEK